MGSDGVQDLEGVLLVVSMGIVGDVEDVVGFKTDFLDDGVVDDGVAEEVLGPVSVWHHSVAQRNFEAVDRRDPVSGSETAADRMSRALRMLVQLIQSLETCVGEEVHAFSECARSRESDLSALFFKVSVTEHVLFGVLAARFLSMCRPCDGENRHHSSKSPY